LPAHVRDRGSDPPGHPVADCHRADLAETATARLLGGFCMIVS
jgi:hypothetical protein